jgi:glc operon protein GlcG
MSSSYRFAAVLAIATTLCAGSAQGKDRKAMDLELAKRVVAAAAAEAQRLGAPGSAIAVVDEGGHLVAFERLEGTFPAGATVSIGKARTAATFQRPTSVFEDAIKNGRISLTAVSEMVPLQGGVPILMDGQVVGAVGVSGAASAQQDEDIAKVAAASVAAAVATRGGK